MGGNSLQMDLKNIAKIRGLEGNLEILIPQRRME